MSAGQTEVGQWHGLKGHEFEKSKCDMVVADVREEPHVQGLEERRTGAAASGDYLDAQRAKVDLKNYYSEECKKRAEKLNQQYEEDLERHEMEFTGKLTNFNADCERAIQEFDAQAEETLKTLGEKQEERHAEHMVKLRAETEPRYPRWSPEALRLRKTQELLVKQREYSQAHMRKQKAEELEELERAQWEQKREKKIKVLEEQFLAKQRHEFANAKKKIATARQELLTKQKREHAKLQFHYNNHKSQVLCNQKVAIRTAQKDTARVACGRSVW